MDMQLYYLVLTIISTVVMPDKYTASQCNTVVSVYASSTVKAVCIPAPKCVMVTSVDNHDGTYGTKCVY